MAKVYVAKKRKLKVGDKVNVKVLGKRFEFGDISINVIGVILLGR